MPEGDLEKMDVAGDPESVADKIYQVQKHMDSEFDFDPKKFYVFR